MTAIAEAMNLPIRVIAKKAQTLQKELEKNESWMVDIVKEAKHRNIRKPFVRTEVTKTQTLWSPTEIEILERLLEDYDEIAVVQKLVQSFIAELYDRFHRCSTNYIVLEIDNRQRKVLQLQKKTTK